MRDVVLYTLVSLDGVAEEPGDWMFEADEDVFTNLAEVIRTQDDILLGRGTYDYWVDYWPTSDVQPFADFINRTLKHVFSSSTPTSPWAQTRIVDDALVPYVARLKGSNGGDIGIHGSIRLAQSLLADDLIDRLELVIVPTLAGHGRRLFTDAIDLRRLDLTKATQSATGCVFLGYQRS
ncbi:dihydrofolate reductase family protein [Fodinibacter luteus]|uniref:Dihydrofolate reductase family protein n=1 Tax=Fodinibacter luteus TaxID=552064 RepID=A0ABP8KMN1_9MICO